MPSSEIHEILLHCLKSDQILSSNSPFVECMNSTCVELFDYLMKTHLFVPSEKQNLFDKFSQYLLGSNNAEAIVALIQRLEGKSEYEAILCSLSKHLNSFSNDISSKNFNIFLDLQVETFFSLVSEQRLNFLIEQLDICVRNRLYQKGKYISQKIDAKSLPENLKEVFLRNKLTLCFQYEEFDEAQKLLNNSNFPQSLVPLFGTLSSYLSKSRVSFPTEIINKNIPEFDTKNFISHELAISTVNKYEKILIELGSNVSIKQALEKAACIHNIEILTRYFTKTSMETLKSIVFVPFEGEFLNYFLKLFPQVSVDGVSQTLTIDNCKPVSRAELLENLASINLA